MYLIIHYRNNKVKKTGAVLRAPVVKSWAGANRYAQENFQLKIASTTLNPCSAYASASPALSTTNKNTSPSQISNISNLSTQEKISRVRIFLLYQFCPDEHCKLALFSIVKRTGLVYFHNLIPSKNLKQHQCIHHAPPVNRCRTTAPLNALQQILDQPIKSRPSSNAAVAQFQHITTRITLRMIIWHSNRWGTY